MCWSPGMLSTCQSCSTCSYRNPRSPLASHFLGGKASQAQAVWDVWACPSRFLPRTPWRSGDASVHGHGTEMWCCSRVGRNTEHSRPVSRAAHLSLTFRNILFFLSTLAKGNEEWTDLKDMIVLGVYSKIIIWTIAQFSAANLFQV